MRALHTAAVNTGCLEDNSVVAADCLVSPLLEQLTALAACVLSAAPQGHALCQKLLKVLQSYPYAG